MSLTTAKRKSLQKSSNLKKSKSKSQSVVKKEKQMSKKVERSDVVDLTSTSNSFDEPLTTVKKEPSEEVKFVIDKSKDSKVEVPVYRNPKPRSLTSVLDSLTCFSNLIPANEVVNKPLCRKAKEALAKKDRMQKRKLLKRLSSSKKDRQEKKAKQNKEVTADPWKVKEKRKTPGLPVAVPLQNNALDCPISYNPDPSSSRLRKVVKEAANVLTLADKKKAKIERIASQIRGAKALTKEEEMVEMSAGLFEIGCNEASGSEEESSTEKIEKSRPKPLTKKQRDVMKKEEQLKNAKLKKKEERIFNHDFYRLKAIRKEVAEAAARRNALQSEEAQKHAAYRRKLAIWHKRLLRQATIRFAGQREASEIIKSAPGELIGDDVNRNSNSGLRLLQVQFFFVFLIFFF